MHSQQLEKMDNHSYENKMGSVPEPVGLTNMECTNFSIYGLFNSLDELFHVGGFGHERVRRRS